MNAQIKEWVAKADGDYVSALRDYRARKQPNYDSACFHAQQCIEKYLKAVLIKKRIAFSKVHDLEVLLDLCLPAYPLWEPMREEMQLLTQYAVQFRYPGESADKEEARQAVAAMKRILADIQLAL
jgi:HEPN domain-containing protein